MGDLLALLFKALIKPILTTKWGVYALSAVIVVAASAYGGYYLRDAQAEKEKSDAVEKAVALFEAQAIEDDRFIRYVEKIKTVIVEKEIEVSHAAAKTELCVDNNPTGEFRRLFNRSVGIANTTTSSPTDGTATSIYRFSGGS